jgi:arylsulfatase
LENNQLKNQKAPSERHPWQLYDMENDRSELTDLAKKYPDKVKALSLKWEKWAVRARVKPWPWKVE